MKKRLLVAAFSALLLTGCPPGPAPHRRYVILNDTGSTITNLTISDGSTAEKIGDETLPGQAWMHSRPFGPRPVIVAWRNESGDHEVKFSENKTARLSQAEFLIALKPRGDFAGRVIEPPAESSNVLALIPVYLLYCLAAALVVGVPLALAAVVAYLLFKVIQAGLIAAGQALRGDRSVFQFSIREIILLTLVTALALGWIVDRQQFGARFDDVARHRTSLIWQNIELRDDLRKLGVDKP